MIRQRTRTAICVHLRSSTVPNTDKRRFQERVEERRKLCVLSVSAVKVMPTENEYILTASIEYQVSSIEYQLSITQNPPLMNLGQIKEATCAPTSCAQKFQQYIQAACDQFNIDTPARELCFLAQVGHESGGLYYTEELASGAAYEGKKSLGNTQPGDGIKFKGRGLIQITGRANYQSVGTALQLDLINNPTLLGGKNVSVCTPAQLKNAALSAAWFWNSKNLNALADKIDLAQPIDSGTNLDNYKAITKKINGGYNGLADRLNRFKSGLKYFEG